MSDPVWVKVCDKDDVDLEDLIRFDHAGRSFAVYRTEDDQWFATAGLCTHEKVHLADGMLIGTTVECPKHNGRFDIRTGAAKGAPVCIDLATFPAKVEGQAVFIRV